MPIRRLPYVLLDVFASRPLEGNQLAVFTDSRLLQDAWNAGAPAGFLSARSAMVTESSTSGWEVTLWRWAAVNCLSEAQPGNLSPDVGMARFSTSVQKRKGKLPINGDDTLQTARSRLRCPNVLL